MQRNNKQTATCNRHSLSEIASRVIGVWQPYFTGHFYIMSRMYFIVVDLIRSERYGLNATESNLCSVLNFLLTRKAMNVDGEEYYLADYDYVAELCHLLPEKRDTLQRLYKRVENIGLIRTMKIGRHLYFTPSDDLRNWGNQFDNIESVLTEKNPHDTEKNPETTEKNPCSLYISNNKEEKVKDKEVAKNEFSPLPVTTGKSFSKENGLTPENLAVKQSVIDKVDTMFERLVFPVDDISLKRMLFVLCCSPKWRGKTINAVQMSLNKVSRYDKDFIIQLIEDSIAGGWQGLVFADTDKKYQEYCQSRNGVTKKQTSFNVITEQERNEALEYLNM